MKELIKIQFHNEQGREVQVVDARELHTILNSKQDFSNWISNRIKKFHFEEGEDFSINLLKTSGRPKKQYLITIDMAKELAMIENNDAGRKTRKYFIECERQLKDIPLTPEELALKAIAGLQQQLAQKSERLKLQETTIKQQAPKVEFYDEVLQSQGTSTATTVGKQLGFTSGRTFNAWLKSLGIQFKQDGLWVLYTNFTQCGFEKIILQHFTKPDGSSGTQAQMVWTPRGIEFCHILKNDGIKAARKYAKQFKQVTPIRKLQKA